MPINFGSANIGEIALGSQQIGEVYRGSDLVWSAEKTGDRNDLYRAFLMNDIYASYTWRNQGDTGSVGEPGRTWTVVAPVPPGGNLRWGGIEVSNSGGRINVKTVSDRATMAYSSPGTYSGTPLVTFVCSTDYSGFRTRLFVNGKSAETANNGGLFKPGESVKGGSMYVNVPWLAFSSDNRITTAHASNDLVGQVDVLNSTAVKIVYGGAWSGVTSIVPAPKVRYCTLVIAPGGNARNETLKRGGTAGETGIIRHKVGEGVEVLMGDVGSGEVACMVGPYGAPLGVGAQAANYPGNRTFRRGLDSGAPTSSGTHIPYLEAPDGSVYGPRAITNSGNAVGPGGGGWYFPKEGGEWPSATNGGMGLFEVYATI